MKNKLLFWPLWPLHDLWGQTKHNFCSHLPTDASDQVSSKSNKACRRRCIFRKNDLFDPCDPYMTFEVKQSITSVATHPLVILTKFGRNPIKHVEEDANCEKGEERKKELNRLVFLFSRLSCKNSHFWPLWPQMTQDEILDPLLW